MYLSFCHFHFLWTELQLNSVRRQTDCRVFGFWALGRGTWDWDLGSELDQAKSSQVDGEACGQHHRVGFSSAFFFACFLHFLHQFRRSLSPGMWGKNMAATKSTNERKLLRREVLVETTKIVMGQLEGSGRSCGNCTRKVTPAKAQRMEVKYKRGGSGRPKCLWSWLTGCLRAARSESWDVKAPKYPYMYCHSHCKEKTSLCDSFLL